MKYDCEYTYRDVIYERNEMKSEAFFLRFLWGPRQETVEQCAERVNSFLTALKAIDRAFYTLHKGNLNGKQFHVPIAPEEITRWLHEGVNRKDIGNAVIPEIGHSLTLICDSDDSLIILRN